MTAYDQLLDALRTHGSHVDERDGTAMAQCPGHDDGRASLSVKRIDGSVLLHCHAACPVDVVLDALGLTKANLYDEKKGATYEYPDNRRVRRTADKKFWQEGNVKGSALFHADRIQAATDRVLVVEGEKDVLAVESTGGVAVCSAMGAGKAAKFDWSPLQGKHVSIVADKDEPGRKHATQVAELLSGIAKSVQIVEAAVGKDAADHIAAGKSLDELVPLYPLPVENSVSATGNLDSPERDDDRAMSPSKVHRGQARIAYRIANRYTGQLLYVSGLGWLHWDGCRWAADDRGAAKRAVLAELRQALGESLDDKELRADVRKCESASGVAGVLDLAAALEPFAASVADLDADPHLLNVANGTVDLRTLELRAHSPTDRITKVCRGAYDPDAASSAWHTFIERVLPDDAVRGFVQRLVGVSLLGEVREHVLPILTGAGANGKSVFFKAILWALGDYGSTAEPDLFMHRDGAHPTGEMDLLGRRLVVISESDKGRRLAEATMKRLTGGDTIRARRMRQDFIEFLPSHTPILITNHLPKVSGDDAAVWRRLRVVPFDVVIPAAEQDRTLDGRLQLEADGILAWAIEGYRQYVERGGLSEPDVVRACTDAYQLASDAVGRFILECCLTNSPVVQATTTQLFDQWEKWRAADGAEPMSLKAFGQAITDKGYPASPPVNGKKWRKGIALKAEGSDSNA